MARISFVLPLTAFIVASLPALSAEGLTLYDSPCLIHEAPGAVLGLKDLAREVLQAAGMGCDTTEQLIWPTLIVLFITCAVFLYLLFRKRLPARALPLKTAPAFVEEERGKRFYMKRAALFLALTTGLFVVELLAFTTLDISTGARSDLMGDSLLFLAILAFSKPLGFWRKALCLVVGMATTVITKNIMATIMYDALTLTAPTERQKAAEALSVTIGRAYTGSIIIDVLAVSLGVYAVLPIQRRWRTRLEA